jgi:hypothetical protein
VIDYSVCARYFTVRALTIIRCVVVELQVSRRETFRPDGYSGTLFRSTERQQIIDFVIRSKIKGEYVLMRVLFFCFRAQERVKKKRIRGEG